MELSIKIPVAAQGRPTKLSIRIPGEPVAQGRPRGFYRSGLGVRMYDPEQSRKWKDLARAHYAAAIQSAGQLSASTNGRVGVEMHVLAVFACPRSSHRKKPVPRRWRIGRPDADNIGKACLDAGTGLLYHDDSQVARLVVEKRIAAQGETPFVQVTVRELDCEEDAL